MSKFAMKKNPFEYKTKKLAKSACKGSKQPECTHDTQSDFEDAWDAVSRLVRHPRWEWS